MSKVNSVQTQWKEADIPDNLFESSEEPVKIKISKPFKPKTKSIEINTDLSFPPNADIIISSQSTINHQEDRKPRKRCTKAKAIFLTNKVIYRKN